MIFRFFCPAPLQAGTSVTLPEEAAHHATRVLRLAPGAAVILFDGAGQSCAGRIASLRPAVSVELTETLPPEPEPPCRVTLVQALASGDKMDWVIQKAVELGVHAVVPVAARRSVLKLDGARAEKRVAHWRKIAIAACEQSGRSRVPAVSDIQPLNQWLARATGGWVLAPAAGQALRAHAPAPAELNLLVGPESGWEPAELEAMQARGVVPLRLGPRILRTETAGLAALAAIQALWGDY
jgi:16S rRNA (uracil1498-N3)-methyltransferase